MRAKLFGKRTHGLILCARRDPQALETFPARFGDQAAEQHGADVLAAGGGFHAEGDLGQRIAFRRMQLGRTADHAIDDIGDDHGAVLGTARGVTLDETVVEKTVEAVVPAFGIEPQQMIAQKRQFFLLAQGPHIAPNGLRAVGFFEC